MLQREIKNEIVEACRHTSPSIHLSHFLSGRSRNQVVSNTNYKAELFSFSAQEIKQTQSYITNILKVRATLIYWQICWSKKKVIIK